MGYLFVSYWYRLITYMACVRSAGLTIQVVSFLLHVFERVFWAYSHRVLSRFFNIILWWSLPHLGHLEPRLKMKWFDGRASIFAGLADRVAVPALRRRWIYLDATLSFLRLQTVGFELQRLSLIILVDPLRISEPPLNIPKPSCTGNGYRLLFTIFPIILTLIPFGCPLNVYFASRRFGSW